MTSERVHLEKGAALARGRWGNMAPFGGSDDPPKSQGGDIPFSGFKVELSASFGDDMPVVD